MNTILKYCLLIILLLSQLACLQEDSIYREIESIEPIELDDGIEIAKPSAVNMDEEDLFDVYEDIFNEKDLWPMKSLLVFKDNKLISEAYFIDKNDIYKTHLIWSCTKQILGILSGMALEKGFLNSINDPISNYLPDLGVNHPDKVNITIEDLLTMRSGIDFENLEINGESSQLLQQIPDNSLEYILSQPIIRKIGEDFHYNDGNPHILSALIQKQVGKPLDEWANEVLFTPLGIESVEWLRYRDGTTFGGFGIEMTSRSLGKIALLVANKGKIGNDQLLANSWISKMTTAVTSIDSTDQFGYLWWKRKEKNINYMWGHGGQFAFIVHEHNLVVVINSFPHTQGSYQLFADEAMPVIEDIIECIE